MSNGKKSVTSGLWAGLDPSAVRSLHKYNTELAARPLAELLSEPGRFENFSRRIDGLLLDFSRVHLDLHAFKQLVGLARESGLEEARSQFFSGEDVNCTERRPALHMAFRDSGTVGLQGIGDADVARESQERMLRLAGVLHEGALPAGGSATVRDIVHIGIGGSLLGPRLLHEALAGREATVPNCHFLGSVDAHTREALLPTLDPATTVVIAVSKSFTTADTLMHARRFEQWLKSALGELEAKKRMFAVTEKVALATATGILPDQTLYLPPWVGGRYSLWSPVSLSAAAAMGPAAFRGMLAGAAAMDGHFRQAGLEENLPVLMGLLGVWHRNICGYGAWAVIPYDQRLRSLPAHLQQVIMESNGKSVKSNGSELVYGTAPVVFGESGTEAQHSLFQALHQGTETVPVNLVGVIRPDHEDSEAHEELLANLLAQATALATGRSERETLAQISAEGGDAQKLLPHRSFAGNRPTEILLLDALNPASLGQLLALYEHKVFVESVIWGINAFDQWGVELGKQLAPDIRQGLGSGVCNATGLDGLLDYIRNRR
jgi:glucose-6-phosphate isomerase